MAYVTASEFVHIPAQSDGTTVRVETLPSTPHGLVPCFCDCGCGNLAADDFCTSCYNICLGEPCDCGLRAESGFYKIHAQGAEGCECNEDGSLRHEYDEMPDGYGGFGASHCACGELTVNCDGKCQYTVEPDPSPMIACAPCREFERPCSYCCDHSGPCADCRAEIAYDHYMMDGPGCKCESLPF